MASPVVDEAYLKEVDKARRLLRALIAQKGCAPIMLRLAYDSFAHLLPHRHLFPLSSGGVLELLVSDSSLHLPVWPYSFAD